MRRAAMTSKNSGENRVVRRQRNSSKQRAAANNATTPAQRRRALCNNATMPTKGVKAESRSRVQLLPNCTKRVRRIENRVSVYRVPEVQRDFTPRDSDVTFDL